MKKVSPAKMFDIYTDYELDAINYDEWNEASDAERVAMVKPICRLVFSRYTTNYDKFFDILTEENYHTVAKVFKSLVETTK